MTTIITRTGKGAPLSWAEADANFENLNQDKLEASANLSDVVDPTTARTNLGLNNVDNTSDIDKPVSTAAQTALNLKADAASPTTTGTLTHSGDIVLSGSGKRITGDFSNATAANRLMFQTSTANIATIVGAIPSGTGTQSNLHLYSSSDPDNSSLAQIFGAATEVRFASTKTGTGAYPPMTFYTGGSERMRIDTNGNVLANSGTGGLGYGTGAGGTVTQATSKSTAVTINKPTGVITTAADALSANTAVVFIMNNSLIAASDCVVVSLKAGDVGGGSYIVGVNAIGAGQAYIYIRNMTAGSRSEALQINFAVIKGATA